MTTIKTIYERAYLIDTCSLISFYDRGDQNHNLTRDFLSSLQSEKIPIIINNLIVAETYRRLLYDLNRSIAISFIEELTPFFKSVEIEQNDILSAMKIIKKLDDQEITLTDAVSMAIMKKYHILKAFSYDFHFTLLGFIIEPP